ncbi:MAG: acyl carrier protein [Myxococcaceae bacterium]|nr:acyl carrier protein [Myxococcaceae bacterium]
MEDLEREVAQFIIDLLNLEDVAVADIDPTAPIFVQGLGLDSIDALELGVGLQKRYGVKLSSDAAENRKHFASVQALCALIRQHRASLGAA